MALMPGLGASRAGLLAPFLAVCRGRLGRRARRLPRPLQPQHQLDQLRLAQALQVISLHAQTESAMPPRCKGVGNYAPHARQQCYAVDLYDGISEAVIQDQMRRASLPFH